MVTPQQADPPSTTKLYVVAAITALIVVVGFVFDTWEFQSPISLPDLPAWLGSVALVWFLVHTFKRDRNSFRHIVLTVVATAVLFGAGLALIFAAAS